MATADAKSASWAQQRLEALARECIAALSPRTLLVGLSGGPDSTLLLALCRKIVSLDPRFSVRAVHCVHGLDADDPIWLAHCRKLCAHLEVPLTIKKLNIVYKNRESPEDSSRQERYRALLEELHGAYLCLGHQADDNVENLFLALKRGSGPRGLAGMRFLTEDARGEIVRPLLKLSRAEIERMTAALGLATVFDISNTYLKFERNFFRLKVLPLIETRFPTFKKAVARSQELCALEHDLAGRFVRPLFEERFRATDLSLSFKGLNLDDEPLCLLLLRFLCLQRMPMPPELARLRQALNLMRGCNGAAGLIELDEHYSLRRFTTRLYLVSKFSLPQLTLQQQEQGIELSVPLAVDNKVSLRLNDFSYELRLLSDPAIAGGADRSDSSRQHAAAVVTATDTATDSATVVKLWVPGSVSALRLKFNPKGSIRLQPAGRAHSRELKKLYQEYQIPSWLRRALPLIEDASGNVLGLGAAFACSKAAKAATQPSPAGYRCVSLEIRDQDGKELRFFRH